MIGVGGWRLAVSGLTMRHPARSIQHSMQHSALCLFQVGLTVLGRPFREVDRLIYWPVGRREREWGLGIGEWAENLLPKS